MQKHFPWIKWEAKRKQNNILKKKEINIHYRHFQRIITKEKSLSHLNCNRMATCLLLTLALLILLPACRDGGLTAIFQEEAAAPRISVFSPSQPTCKGEWLILEEAESSDNACQICFLPAQSEAGKNLPGEEPGDLSAWFFPREKWNIFSQNNFFFTKKINFLRSACPLRKFSWLNVPKYLQWEFASAVEAA